MSTDTDKKIWVIYMELKSGTRYSQIYVGKSPSRTKIYREYKNEFDYNEKVECFGYKRVD